MICNQRIKDPAKLYANLYAPPICQLSLQQNTVPRCISHLQDCDRQLGAAAKTDANAFARDRALNPPSTHGYNGRFLWEGLVADEQMRADMAAGVHLQMDPKDFWDTRE